jgi:uncharacterized protein
MPHFTSFPDNNGGPSSSISEERHQTERRIEAIMETIPWIQPETIERIVDKIIYMNARPALKLTKLTELANKFNEALRPHYTCRKGCYSCCSMTTLIYRYEAVRLADVTSRKMVELPFRPYHEVLSAGNLVYGKQCAFVANGLCSVYEHRPMICRLHHSFNTSNNDCIISVERSGIFRLAMIDPDYIEMPYHYVVRSSMRKEPWGAITEFFPT